MSKPFFFWGAVAARALVELARDLATDDRSN
jgi:hypothetical protein